MSIVYGEAMSHVASEPSRVYEAKARDTKVDGESVRLRIPLCGILPGEEMISAYSTKSVIIAKHYPERQTLKVSRKRFKKINIYPLHSWIVRQTPTLKVVGSNPIG